jgi:4-amino-4-deoxy-L-arabinose transferase-like glycosyltransferase
MKRESQPTTSGAAAAAAHPAVAPDSRQRELRWLWIAVSAAVLVKLLLLLFALSYFKDQISALYGIGHADNYQTLAKSISHGRGYRFFPDTALTLMREPGYPYFLAVFVHEFEDYKQAALVANMLIGGLAAILVFALARRLTALPWVPLTAALLFMAHPGIVLAELRASVETLFIFLLLIFMLLLCRALALRSVRNFAWAGMALGVATLVRSTALLFPVFLAAHAFLLERGWRPLVNAAGRAALVIACALLVLTPWIVRNYQLVGKFIPTASVQGIAMQAGYYLCVHNGERSFAELDQDAADQRNEIAAAQGYRFKPSYYQFFYDTGDEVKFNGELGREVVRQYVHSPATFAKCASENVFNFWYRGKNTAATTGNVVVQSLYMLLAIGGVWLGRRAMDRSVLTLLLLFVAYNIAVYAPIHAQARYSLAVVPILAVLGAVPICACWRGRQRPMKANAA